MPCALVTLAITGVAIGSAYLFPGSSESAPEEPPAEETAPPGIVTLPANQRETSGIHCSTIESEEIREVRRVPGKIGYNASQRIEVVLPVPGVVTQVLVQQGDTVHRGTPLAVLTSTEVGLARTELAAAEAEVALARQASAWASEVAASLERLAQALVGNPPMAEVERQFDDSRLGQHRERVLSAYSKLLLAEKSAASSDSVAASGALSGLIIQERRSAREVATAQFKAALEQSRFEAAQQQGRAQAELNRAEHLLTVAQQKLKLLLGPLAEVSPAEQDSTLCQLTVRAPMDGIVEQRLVTDGAHTSASQVLFAIANTNTLWVSAHIYDRQWSEFNPREVGEVLVEAPAVPDHAVPARVLYTAVTTSADSGAVPLVAELPNADGRFRPGMFAWVTVPVNTKRRVLSVPLSAVTRNERQAFVFVEEKPGIYRRVDVDLGATSGDRVEVLHGLEPGQRIVDSGVFLLKSELLLGQIDS
jgi:cobalt-zinc-cadmium efflux system membrane fusion protein